MSVIEDTRKVLQDVIAPDLKAINVRLDAVERVMGLRFEQVDKRFEQVDKRFEQVDKRFEQVDKRFEQVDKRFEQMGKHMDERFAQSEKLTLAKFEQVDRRFEQMDKRMDERFAQSEKLTLAKFDQVLARIELLTNVVGANHQAEMNAMDLNRRIERIELSIAPKSDPGLLKS